MQKHMLTDHLLKVKEYLNLIPWPVFLKLLSYFCTFNVSLNSNWFKYRSRRNSIRICEARL